MGVAKHASYWWWVWPGMPAAGGEWWLAVRGEWWVWPQLLKVSSGCGPVCQLLEVGVALHAIYWRWV